MVEPDVRASLTIVWVELPLFIEAETELKEIEKSNWPETLTGWLMFTWLLLASFTVRFTL